MAKVVQVPPHMAPFSVMMELSVFTRTGRDKFAALAEAAARMKLKPEHVAEVSFAFNTQLGRVVNSRSKFAKSIQRILTDAHEWFLKKNEPVEDRANSMGGTTAGPI